MPSYIVTVKSVTKDGSNVGAVGAVMATAATLEEAKQQGASLLGVPAAFVEVTPYTPGQSAS